MTISGQRFAVRNAALSLAQRRCWLAFTLNCNKDWRWIRWSHGPRRTQGEKIQMTIKIVCVGKLKEKYFKAAIAEYAKRLSRFTKFSIVEVADEKAPEKLSAAQMDQVMGTEGDRILGKIKDKEYVIALAIKGRQRPSEVFAQELKDLATYGHSDVTFVIGGSLGLSPAVLQRANDQLSFGQLTLPHQLMRVVLSEQIYRAFMINEGSPYHK